MATKIETVTKDLYESDFYVWTERQAELLRARRFDELDLDHLIEEVEDLGISAKNAVQNNARVVIEHLLKLQYSPAQNPRNGWRDAILEHRARLEGEITPQLRRLLAQNLPQVYDIARRKTAKSMKVYGEDVAANRLPTECPYSLDQVLGDWLP